MNSVNQSPKKSQPNTDLDEILDEESTLVQSYERDGYLFPLTVMDSTRAAEYRKQLESFESAMSNDPELRKLALQNGAYLLPFVDEISRLESILEPVKRILGPNVMVWNAGFFTKEPHTTDFISWHQDLTYWGLSDSHEVTAWVALSPSTPESGCVKFVAGTHQLDIVKHRDTFDKKTCCRVVKRSLSMSTRRTQLVELQPGEMSLHHGKVFHGSNANRSDDRRIGLAIRYISPEMRQTVEEKTTAKLVTGVDKYSHFRLIGEPRGVLDPDDLASVKENIRIQHQFLFAGVDK